MASDYSRIHRLLHVLTLIQGSTGWTAKRLAVECRTTERTIYRDLKMLEGAGIPYFYDEPSKGYSIRRDFFMPPVQLTLEETLALAALGEQIGGREQIPYLQTAVRAIAKVRGQLPQSLRNELEKIEQHVRINLAAASPPEAADDVYQRVRDAISARRMLRCAYESIRQSTGGNGSADAEPGEQEIFLFKPYALLFNQRAWYVVGHHGGRSALRCLKLSRFARCEPTDRPYLIPSSFSLDKHLGKAWRMIRGPRCYDVELEFDPLFAETVADTHWHRTQQIDWLDDGSIRFRCQVEGLDEIVWWVLGMGPHCLVRQPPELIERVRGLAAQMQARYADPAPAPQPGKGAKPGK